MNIDVLLSAVLKRILNDEGIDGETDLGDILATLKGNKGARKPAGATNPWFTVNNMPSNVDADTTTENGTVIINCYIDNFSSGIAKTRRLGAVGDRLKDIFHDQPFSYVVENLTQAELGAFYQQIHEMEGYNNYNLVARSISGPLFDPDDPDEHYISVRLKYNVIKQ